MARDGIVGVGRIVAGSLQKRGKNSWRLVVSAGFDPVTGRRRQVRRTVRGSKRQAELALARLVVEVQGGAHAEQSRMPLATYLRERYLVKARTRLRPETWDRYESLLRIHVIPRIGSLPLDKLRPSHVDSVMAEMAKGGAAPASVRQAYRVLSRALKEAVRLQLISANPAESVDPPRVPRAVLHVPTKEGLATLLDGIREGRWASPIAFAVGTGLRRGELLGLRWPDVDLDRRSVNVNWELQRHRGRGLVFVEPKTDRARREVRLSHALVAMLEQVRVDQDERRSLLGPVWQEHGVVFDAGDGRPIDPDYFTEACKRTFKAVGMPDAMRLHDLRHAFGSLLFAAGVHPKVASAALGHASEAFTMSVYQHMSDGMGDRVAEVISDALPGLGVNLARSTPPDASEPAREGASDLPRRGSENDTSLGKDGPNGQAAAL